MDINSNKSGFPIGVLPPSLQHIILALVRCLSFSVDYTAASILLTVAASIGKTYKLKVKNSWVESTCIFLCLVGRPGANKSHPLSWAIKPLLEATERNFGFGGNGDDMFSTETPKPFIEQLVANNITPEAIFQIMEIVNKRLLIYTDEISGFLRNLNKYNAGSDVEILLSIFSGITAIINRKTQEKFMLRNPIACIVGTTQPEVLKALFQKSENNGLFDRFIFTYLEEVVKPKMVKEDLDPSIITQYNEIINKLLSLDLDASGESNIICFTPEAEEIAFAWFNQNADRVNDEPDDRIRGIYIKLDIYFYRFALILEILSWACGEGTLTNVGVEATKNAIELIEYFRDMNVKTLKILSQDPYDAMTELQRKVYDAIKPKENTDGEFEMWAGLKAAEVMGMSVRNFKYFVKRTDLFKRLKAGKYKKLF